MLPLPRRLAKRAGFVSAVEAYGPAVRDLRRNLELSKLDNVINNSKGCGGVMRVAPLGIFNEDPVQAAQNAAEAAAITHTHPLGFISAAVLAFLVSTFTHRDNPQVTKDDFKEALLACYTMLKEKFSEFKEDVEVRSGKELKKSYPVSTYRR